MSRRMSAKRQEQMNRSFDKAIDIMRANEAQLKEIEQGEPYGHCDTCGAILKIKGECPVDPSHQIAIEPELQASPELNAYISRLRSASRSLFKSVGGPFALWEAGTELVGVIELRNGKQGQFHLTLVSDENEFLDGDVRDLVVTPTDFALTPTQAASEQQG